MTYLCLLCLEVYCVCSYEEYEEHLVVTIFERGGGGGGGYYKIRQNENHFWKYFWNIVIYLFISIIHMNAHKI